MVPEGKPFDYHLKTIRLYSIPVKEIPLIKREKKKLKIIASLIALLVISKAYNEYLKRLEGDSNVYLELLDTLIEALILGMMFQLVFLTSEKFVEMASVIDGSGVDNLLFGIGYDTGDALVFKDILDYAFLEISSVGGAGGAGLGAPGGVSGSQDELFGDHIDFMDVLHIKGLDKDEIDRIEILKEIKAQEDEKELKKILEMDVKDMSELQHDKYVQETMKKRAIEIREARRKDFKEYFRDPMEGFYDKNNPLTYIFSKAMVVPWFLCVFFGGLLFSQKKFNQLTHINYIPRLNAFELSTYHAFNRHQEGFLISAYNVKRSKDPYTGYNMLHLPGHVSGKEYFFTYGSQYWVNKPLMEKVLEEFGEDLTDNRINRRKVEFLRKKGRL